MKAAIKARACGVKIICPPEALPNIYTICDPPPSFIRTKKGGQNAGAVTGKRKRRTGEDVGAGDFALKVGVFNKRVEEVDRLNAEDAIKPGWTDGCPLVSQHERRQAKGKKGRENEKSNNEGLGQ